MSFQSRADLFMLATLMGITCWKDHDKADLRILSDLLRRREELARVRHTQDGRIHLLDVIGPEVKRRHR